MKKLFFITVSIAFLLLTLCESVFVNHYRRSRMHTQLAREISSVAGSNQFMRLKGDFSVKEMKKIAIALEDGKLYESELSDKLVKKLKETGNVKMFEQVTMYPL